jgi:cytochrome P450
VNGQPIPPSDDVLRFEELPMAESRTAAYKIVREAGPVARDDHGAYVITTGEGAEFALRHPELFSSKRAFDGVGSPVPMVPIGTDPPEHTRYRRLLQPMFSPRSTAPWQPPIRALAGELIENVLGKGECDLVADLAVPLPAQVFLTLFGLPQEDSARLLAWKDAILDTVGIRGAEAPSEESARLGAELYGYLVGHIARRRAQGGTDDMLGQLIADPSEDRLNDDELLGLSFQFVLAGLDTVTCAMSTIFATLASQPALRQQIVADPSLIPDAIEELLRMDGPVATLPRVVTQDVELGGQTIPAGNYVQVAVAVANRDPAEHADPDTIDFRRQERHLAFGGGPHGCLGSHLARMEMRVALEEWHRRIPEYRLAPGVTPRATWPAGLVGIDSLPLVFPPGGGGGQ